MLWLYVIFFGVIIAIALVLIRILQSVRQGAPKSGGLAGLALSMTVLFGIFRDPAPQDKKKITLPTSKKKP